LQAIQVCYELNDGNRARGIIGLQSAMKKLSCKKEIIITFAQEEMIDDQARVIPL